MRAETRRLVVVDRALLHEGRGGLLGPASTRGTRTTRRTCADVLPAPGRARCDECPRLTG